MGNQTNNKFSGLVFKLVVGKNVNKQAIQTLRIIHWVMISGVVISPNPKIISTNAIGKNVVTLTLHAFAKA